MRLVVAVLAGAAAMVVVAAPAAADDDSSGLLTTPDALHARLDGTNVVFAVRYALDVESGYQTNPVDLTIPPRGIVIGATATIAGRDLCPASSTAGGRCGSIDGEVHQLALGSAERTEATFQAIGDHAGGAHRMWAVHVTFEGATSGFVRVAIAAPHPARVLLELEVSAPTCFLRDVRYAAVPAQWRPKLDESLLPDEYDAVVDAACHGQTDSRWLAFPSRDLAAQPFGDQRIGTLGGRLALDVDDLARVELDLSHEISQVPPDLYTAIVIDGSRSVTQWQRAAQQTIVEAYLRAAPRSRVQIIEYDRTPHALLPDWTTASQAIARASHELDAMTARNGSNFDRGLAEAARWLARAPGTRRIVVFTDELLAKRLADIPAASWRNGLPAGTLVHVVALDEDGAGALDRDDDALLAPLAAATEGMAVHGRIDGGHVDVTKLLRPIALEQIKILSPGWETDPSPTGDGCPFDSAGDVPEGHSCSWWGLGDASAGPIRIEGLLWGRHFSRVVRPDPTQGRSLARIVSAINGGFDDRDCPEGRCGLIDGQVMSQIDRAAYAVNAAWSLLGTWAGHDGYADLAHSGGGRWGSGSGFSGADVGSVNSARGPTVRSPPPEAVQAQLARGMDKCEIGDTRFNVHLELTVEEIVDVEITMYAGSRALRDCIEEAVWETALKVPAATSHATITVAFGS